LHNVLEKIIVSLDTNVQEYLINQTTELQTVLRDIVPNVNFNLEEKRNKLLKWLSDRNYRTELVYMNGVSVRN
jgi:hypothetical protein